jgi:hypothetical protein
VRLCDRLAEHFVLKIDLCIPKSSSSGFAFTDDNLKEEEEEEEGSQSRRES